MNTSYTFTSLHPYMYIYIYIFLFLPVTTPALIGICLGSALFLVTVAAVTCFCYKRRTTSGSSQKLTSVLKKNCHHHSEKPLVLRKPSAVKSPSSGCVGGPVLMKKSPSPTLQKAPSTRSSPTGQRTPTEKGGIIVTSSSNHSSRQNSPNIEDKSYIESENEKLKNGSKKEELEENKEKEVLVEKPCKLGQLHFRYVTNILIMNYSKKWYTEVLGTKSTDWENFGQQC